MQEALLVGQDEGGMRLDLFLAQKISGVSRSRLHRWISEGRVSIEGVSVRPSLPLRAGWRVVLDRPADVPTTLAAEPVPLEIVHEDEDLIVINKPAGLAVHPGAGRSTGTLVHGLLHLHPDREWPGSPERPGIVHRLDRDTTGLLLVACQDKSYIDLRRQISEREVRRAYVALVWGTPTLASGLIDLPIGRDPRDRRRMAVVRRGGRASRTRYRVLKEFGPVSLLEVRLETGRTHQIRVHLAHGGFPVFGDSVYGGGRSFLSRIAMQDRPRYSEWLRCLNRQALHAYHLGLRHPRDHQWWVFEAPVPDDFDLVLRGLVASAGGSNEVQPGEPGRSSDPAAGGPADGRKRRRGDA